MFDYKAAATAKVKELEQVIKSMPEWEVPNIARITWRLRGRTAGVCHYQINTRTQETLNRFEIKLHPTLAKKYESDYINRTVTHEYAHAVVAINHSRASIKPHGPEWQHVMRKLGGDPSRCHNYDISSVPTELNKVEISCDCRSYKVTQRKAARLTSFSICRRCEKDYTYVDPIVVRKVAETAVKRNTSRTQTKYQKGKKLYIALCESGQYTTKEMIGKLMTGLDMSKAGATTYYYKYRKECGAI